MKNLTLLGGVALAVTLFGMSSAGVGAYGAYNYNIEETKPVVNSQQVECMALNIYHEARSESELGQRAVAYVTLNRVNDPAYPDNICGVVHQAVLKNNVPVRNKCQFSWYCDGKDDEPRNAEAYAEAKRVALIVINRYGSSFDPTMGATMYHTDSVIPGWRTSFEKTTQIENHIFYRKE